MDITQATHESANGFKLHLTNKGEWFTNFIPEARELVRLDSETESSLTDRGIVPPIVNIKTGKELKCFNLKYQINHHDSREHKEALFFAENEDEAVKQWRELFSFEIDIGEVYDGLDEVEQIIYDEFLKRRYLINMPDKSIYAVPIEVIAKHRAEAYKKDYNGNQFESMVYDTLPLFKSDEYAIRDWASNNMNWSDVKNHAVCVEFPDDNVDYDDGWCNGAYEIKE